MKTNHAAEILAQVKHTARNAHAWPGGYPLAVLMSDGETLCPACCKTEFRNIARATIAGLRDDWKAEAAFIHYEGRPLVCANCYTETPSAYGDPDAEEPTP